MHRGDGCTTFRCDATVICVDGNKLVHNAYDKPMVGLYDIRTSKHTEFVDMSVCVVEMVVGRDRLCYSEPNGVHILRF